jgi:hypothetical protein
MLRGPGLLQIASFVVVAPAGAKVLKFCPNRAKVKVEGRLEPKERENMNRFQRSWLLFKSSVSVVLNNKKLLIFPILSFVFTAIVLFFVVVPLGFQKTGYGLGQLEHWKAVGQSLVVARDTATAHTGRSDVALKPLAVAFGALIYLVSMFLATFFNVAFFHQILNALRGSPVSVEAGLKFALSKIKPILLWSLFAGVIGLIIKTLEQRLDLIGRIVMRLIGVAWSVASVFAIPVMIVEPEINPITVLRKSAATLKKTWGESLVGYLGLRFGGFLVTLVSIVLLGAATVLAVMLNSFWIFAVSLVLWFFSIIVFAYLTNVASQVYRCALYIYASDGTIPAPFDNDMLQMAWKLKKA